LRLLDSQFVAWYSFIADGQTAERVEGGDMIGSFDIYEILNRAGILYALLLIVILLMYIAFYRQPQISKVQGQPHR